MQLKIQRSQEMKGLISKKAHFTLSFRVQYTPEERQLIDNSKLGKQVLTTVTLPGLLDTLSWDVTLDRAQEGERIECPTLGVLVALENRVKAACEDIRNYLALAQSFDGREEITEYPLNPVKALPS